jgi:hypothetical protein
MTQVKTFPPKRVNFQRRDGILHFEVAPLNLNFPA